MPAAQNLPECHVTYWLTKQNSPNSPGKGNEDMAKQRFIKSVVAAAAQDTPQMPWARGARRAAFIAKRTPTKPQFVTAKAA